MSRLFLLFLACLSSFTLASVLPQNSSSSFQILQKRDPSYVPANIALESCSIKKNFTSHITMTPGIQMAECYINARIVPQAFAWFEPTDPYNAQNEGGLYGNCFATSEFPPTEDLIFWENANYACFFWTEKNIPNQGKLPDLTGREIIPFPVVCPHNLPGCYSKGIYSEGGIMAKFGDQLPTFSGVWKPPKAEHSNAYLWCDHIQDHCPIATNEALQLENIAKLKCDVANCPKYEGSLAILDDASRAKATNMGLRTIIKGGAAAGSNGRAGGEVPGAGGGSIGGPGSGSGSGSSGGIGGGNGGGSGGSGGEYGDEPDCIDGEESDSSTLGKLSTGTTQTENPLIGGAQPVGGATTLPVSLGAANPLTAKTNAGALTSGKKSIGTTTTPPSSQGSLGGILPAGNGISKLGTVTGTTGTKTGTTSPDTTLLTLGGAGSKNTAAKTGTTASGGGLGNGMFSNLLIKRLNNKEKETKMLPRSHRLKSMHKHRF